MYYEFKLISPTVMEYTGSLRRVVADSTERDRVIAIGVGMGIIQHLKPAACLTLEEANASLNGDLEMKLRTITSAINEVTIIKTDVVLEMARRFYLTVVTASVCEFNGLVASVGSLADALYGMHRYIDGDLETYIDTHIRDVLNVAFATKTLLDNECKKDGDHV